MSRRRLPLVGLLAGALACGLEPVPTPADASPVAPIEAPASADVEPPSAPPGARPDPHGSDFAQEQLRRDLQTVVEELLADPEIGGVRLGAVEDMLTFYELREYAPAWIDVKGPTEAASRALARIESAVDHGLAPADYHVDALRGRVAAKSGYAIHTELLITDGLLLGAGHLLRGRIDPAELDPEWGIDRPKENVGRALHATLQRQSRDLFEDLGSHRLLYDRLLEARRRLVAVAEAGGWPKAASAGDEAAVRERLRISGDLTGDGSDPLAAALVAFQERHGLDPSGEVDPATLAALNVPVQGRIDQIDVNLERWRWLPKTTPPRVVVVNIAGYELYVIDGDQLKLRMLTAVGKRYRKTPVFDDVITHIVVNPTWSVPAKLARKDVVPKILRDRSLVEQKGFRVFKIENGTEREVDPSTVDWSRVGTKGHEYKLRQRAGPDNSLGQLKFMFPNRHNIYLHDTPHRGDFKKSRRAVSSGCIRLEKPIALAELLLEADPDWTEGRLQAALDSGRQQTIWLKQPVPVYLTYLTAWVRPDGTLQFRDDIYRRDRRLLTALRRAVGPAPR